MNLGYFDDDNKEYVITTPRTPLPWINYLGCESFFRLISNTGGGYAFYKDAKLLRLTRYRYNNAPLDSNGHYFYINDNGCIWNPGWQPVQTELDSYECRHGLGYTTYKGSKNGIEAHVALFVPIGANCELTRLSLNNTSDKSKTFSVYSYIEFCLWNAVDDMNNFQRTYSTGEVEIEPYKANSCIYHKTEYRERRNHYALCAMNSSCDGFDTDRDSFLGTYGSPQMPDAVAAKTSHNSKASGWNPVASFRKDITLKPNEKCHFIYMLGYIENPDDEKWEVPQKINKQRAKAMIDTYMTDEAFDNAFNRLKEHWNNLLSKYTLETSDDKLCRMVNIWNQYQCMVTFNMSRSASYYESGTGRGMGFRDSCQDLLGFVHLIPDAARQRILDIASTQFENGSAYHQYQPLTKQGNSDIGSGFNDDPLWLIAGTAAYLKETGDYSILDEMTPFDCNKENTASLMEHLRRSFNFTTTHLGPHNLPLIGRADWNDCLNLNCFSWDPNESFQTTENKSEGSKAESLMIAGLFVVTAKQYVELCNRIAKHDEAERMQKAIDAMVAAVKKDGWDGEWYLRAYDFFGNKIGSHECEEAKIFIESQGWCTMAEIGADEGMVGKSLDSCKKYLECEHGMVLNNPAFTKYIYEYGEISSYPEGYKENAGIFCHNNPWVIIGEAIAGRGNDAWAHYAKILPSYVEEKYQTLHKVEPYVNCQMVAGKDAARPGEGKNSWLTGTAAWMWLTVSQYILGVKPQYDGLQIDPCLPTTAKEYTIQRKFRDAEYTITIKNPEGKEHGVSQIVLDGSAIEGNTIPYSAGKHTVEVVM